MGWGCLRVTRPASAIESCPTSSQGKIPGTRATVCMTQSAHVPSGTEVGKLSHS